jgi:hypothetical protein
MGGEFTAYLDDSGHPDDTDVVVVAGLLASGEQSSLLESDWKSVLARHRLGFFHMADFEAGHEDYKHLSVRERLALPCRLASLICSRAQLGYCFIVPMADYRRVNSEWALQECIGSPYGIAGDQIVKELSTWRKRNQDKCENLRVVFDDGSKHKGDLMECLGRDRLLSDASFRNKKEITALQAADFLAWECYHSFETKQVRESLGMLLRLPFEHGIFSHEDLLGACDQEHVMKRAELPSDAPVLFASALKRPRKRTIA